MLTHPRVPPSIHEQAPFTKALVQNMERFLKKDLQISLGNSHFLLALSGGADSLALLCCFLWLKQCNIHKNITISVAHLDHALRNESAQEAQAVQSLCSAWNIPLFLHRINIRKHAREQGHEDMCALEENARNVRYTCFELCRKACGAQWLVLAHHLGDLQEDVLMRLTRGAAWPALGGMTALDDERHILRPLLLQEPEHLRKALRHASITWIEDASNTDTSFFRNRVRHNILPLFHEKNESFSQNISTIWKLSRADKAHWESAISDICLTHNIRPIYNKDNAQSRQVHLPANALKNASKATRLRLYVHAMKLLVPHTQTRAHTLFQLDEAFEQGRGGTTFQFTNKILAHLKKHAITFSIQ